MGARGQIVIPIEARNIFEIKPGDILLVAGDKNKGIAITKVEGLKKYVLNILGALEKEPLEEDSEEEDK